MILSKFRLRSDLEKQLWNNYSAGQNIEWLTSWTGLGGLWSDLRWDYLDSEAVENGLSRTWNEKEWKMGDKVWDRIR